MRWLHLRTVGMIARNRGNGCRDFGSFLHAGIGRETPSDNNGQSSNATGPQQEWPDYRRTFGRWLRDQIWMTGKLALQRHHGPVAAKFRLEFLRTHFIHGICPRPRWGFRNRQNALARPRRRADVVVEVYRRTHDRLPCFQAPIAQRIRRLPPIVDFVGCNMTNSYDSCPSAA